MMWNRIIFKRKKVSYVAFPRINGITKIHGNGTIQMGTDVRINSSESSNPIGGMTFTMLAAYGDAKINLGNNVGMSNCAIVCRKSVTVEDNVKIGGNVKIYDTDFHALGYESRVNNVQDIGAVKPILIKKGAFIGAHSIILKGVTIGEKSIVGAGSVVTKSIPDGEIWAGNPAKFIKRCN
ncbi:acyltransferase [Brevibacterium sp. PAMC21349]|nr:acyltransferase [Brevibacterium sp. PAMC21349]